MNCTEYEKNLESCPVQVLIANDAAIVVNASRHTYHAIRCHPARSI